MIPMNEYDILLVKQTTQEAINQHHTDTALLNLLRHFLWKAFKQVYDEGKYPGYYQTLLRLYEQFLDYLAEVVASQAQDEAPPFVLVEPTLANPRTLKLIEEIAAIKPQQLSELNGPKLPIDLPAPILNNPTTRRLLGQY